MPMSIRNPKKTARKSTKSVRWVRKAVYNEKHLLNRSVLSHGVMEEPVKESWSMELVIVKHV